MNEIKKERSDKQILLALALHGPLTISGIAGETKLSKSTVYEAIYGKPRNQENSLLTGRGGLVKIAKEEKYRTGLKTCTYALTLTGLCELLYLIIPSSEIIHIDAIAEKQKDLLPFLFTRWKFFKDQGFSAVKILRSGIASWRNEAATTLFETEKFLCDNSIRMAVERGLIKYFAASPDIEVLMNWNKILHLDPELRERAKEFHEQVEIKYRLQEQAHKIKGQIIEMLGGPNIDWEEIRKRELATQIGSFR